MITIVDYGVGNLGSVLNMFRYLGVPANVSSCLSVINKASKLLLPGVGAFDSAISRINSSGLRDVLDHKVLIKQTPVLGICLGTQLLTRGSEEGKLPGLGWIPAETSRFPSLLGLRVPHMGWNLVTPNTPSELTQDLPLGSRFYFVHSYYITVDSPQHSILRTSYGIEFDSAIQCGNIYGTQFHPEKSHKFGMHLLKNFSDI